MHGKKIRYSQLTDIDYSNNVKRFCFNKEMEHSENMQATRYITFSIHNHEKVHNLCFNVFSGPFRTNQ